MTRKELLPQVEALLIDVRDMCERIALSRPGSLPTAQLCVDDVVRAYSLIESARNKISNKRAREINARLVRANLLSEALNAEVQ